MKKLTALLVVVVMMLAMGVATFAAVSPTPTPTPPASDSSTQGTAPSGVSVASGSISVSEWNGDGGVALANAIAAINGQLLTTFDLTGTGLVTLNVAGVLAGQSYVILHYTAAGVETIYPTAIGNGTISFNVGSNSPFAIVAVPNGSVKSPRTSAY